MKQMPIPDAAARDPASVEVLRVWIAENGMHCAIKVGMYVESKTIGEEVAWGMVLADAAQHIASALEKRYSMDAQTTLRAIQKSFEEELDEPTTKSNGDFVSEN